MGLVERTVRTLKDILKKNTNLSQLHLSELVYAMNCKEGGDKGSAMTKFMGRGTRGNLPNSWDKSVDWKQQLKKRGEEREKRVKKKERIVEKKETHIEGERVRL